jgi:hypothetical protein
MKFLEHQRPLLQFPQSLELPSLLVDAPLFSPGVLSFDFPLFGDVPPALSANDSTALVLSQFPPTLIEDLSKHRPTDEQQQH